METDKSPEEDKIEMLFSTPEASYQACKDFNDPPYCECCSKEQQEYCKKRMEEESK